MNPPDRLLVARDLEDRVRDLGAALAYAAETHLATLERLSMRKSAPKSDLTRQESICKTLVAQCAELKVEPRGLSGRETPRLKEHLQVLAKKKPRA